MENDFIYWRHPTVPGIKVEEVTGGDRYSGSLWRDMARQVYCENGKEAYREIGHFSNGAPFLHGDNARISLTHCDGFFAVATLPSTPEVDLKCFSPRAALGIDAEHADRAQVLKLRGKFLSTEEQKMIDADDVMMNVLAWTIKEAAYKAAFIPGLEFASDIRITRLPLLGPPTPYFDKSEFEIKGDKDALPEKFFGEVAVRVKDVDDTDSERIFRLYSYLSDDFIVTLCYDPKCAKFGKIS
ncbi:MAG: 4'-phosphopantetheinyl transferase superfamily protein [Bacteroides sp.]|nr:4'-phosphopantetheinyl transferase superfamily protein [Bacteroides sp.]